jgi:phenylacetate-CoA ligase
MFPQDMNEMQKSALPEIAWPPIPSDQAASLLALLSYLEQSQWWPGDRLLASQLRQAEILLRHARQTTAYYGAKLSGFDLSGPSDLARWMEIPLLTRSDIQSAGDALVSRQLPPSHGKVFTTQTSGSTGQPVVVHGTDLTQHFWNVLTIREHLWHRRSLDGVHAIIRVLENAPKEGRENPDWGAPFNLIWRTGPSAMLNLVTEVNLQMSWLKNLNPRYLLTHPSNLSALLELFETSGERLPALSQVRSIGETLTPEIREACKRVWDVPVIDIYSSQEAGYIALQCPDGDCYHVQSENLLVEVLDDGGMPCSPGETGQVVVTTLHNFAAPLIRYAIGDYAEVAEPCRCGRGLPVIRRIMGRRRNLITLPTGERFWPVFGIRKFREIAPVCQYQIIQTTLERLEIRLVVEIPLTEEQEQRLQDVIRAAVGYPMKISFIYPDEIRIIAGKHEEFRSEV